MLPYEREKNIRALSNAVLKAGSKDAALELFTDKEYTPEHIVAYCRRSKNAKRFARVVELLTGTLPTGNKVLIGLAKAGGKR